MTKKQELNFEDAIKELEAIISNIEDGSIDLETALNQYQTGINLVKFCQDKLKTVEQKIKILNEETNQLKDFGAE